MSMIFKPNLAGTPTKESDIQFPVLASPKIDGVRAMVHKHGLMSRSMKPLPNEYIQALLNRAELVGLDGELVVGSPTHPNCMQNTTSGVMSVGKVPEFTYLVFDRHDIPNQPFHDRLHSAGRLVETVRENWIPIATSIRLDGGPLLECPIQIVPHERLNSLAELLAYEAKQLELGYEGVMIRSPYGLYKYGRSTAREGGLLKIKRFVDAEFLVVGFEEQMKNNNAKQVNELGRTKRSTHAAGLEGKGTLGALKVRHIVDWDSHKLGAQFNIGSGMDDNLRAHIWANQDKYMNAIGTYKSFPIGVMDAPRHPVFKSFRPLWDIST